jgi:KDO2-lipid IV(A) lauroyltransferase
MTKNKIKKIRYFFEVQIVRLSLFLFKILGIKKAANFSGFLARFIGKKHKTNELARKNIKKSLPNLSDEEIEKILVKMWDNLGRIIGEFTHICAASPEELMKIVVADKKSQQNIKNIKENAAKTGKGGIIFSGHIGNWEIGPKIFVANGINVKTVYRTLNNVAVDKMTSQIRGVEMIPKSSKGSKQIIEEIKKGNFIIIMADQKITGGIPVPFFGRNAKTTTSIAKLALKYSIPLIPARAIRINQESKFAVYVEEPILVQQNDDEKSLTLKINQKLEEWISQYPAQWFWVHDRWKK